MNWQPFRGNAPENMTIFSASFPDVSDQWPMKDDTIREINAIDQALKADTRLMSPLLDYEEGGLPILVPRHRFSEQAYRNRPALEAWRTRLVPTALALFVLQNPLEERLPEGTKWTATAASGLSTPTMPSAFALAPGCWAHWSESTFTTISKATGLAWRVALRFRCWRHCAPPD
jgi:hypothetical protein